MSIVLPILLLQDPRPRPEEPSSGEVLPHRWALTDPSMGEPPTNRRGAEVESGGARPTTGNTQSLGATPVVAGGVSQGVDLTDELKNKLASESFSEN